MPDGLTSWREVERIALALRDAGWIFRGQSNPWPLQPAVGRAAAGGGLASSPAAERAMLEEFKQRARRQMADVEVPASDLEWLALARSHGLPTRLLDLVLRPLRRDLLRSHPLRCQLSAATLCRSPPSALSPGGRSIRHRRTAQFRSGALRPAQLATATRLYGSSVANPALPSRKSKGLALSHFDR